MKPPALFLFVFLVVLATSRAFTQPPRALHWSRMASLPDTNGVAAPFAGVSGGALIIAGGANFPAAKPWEGGNKVWHDIVYVLDRPAGEWKAVGKLPRPLAYGVSVTHRGEVICVGGSDDQQHSGETFALAWRHGKLVTRTLPALPKPMANGCGALLGNTVYVAGGSTSPGATNALHAFFRLQLDKPELGWSELPAWPGPARMLATAAVQEGAFFLIGGVELLSGPNGKPARRYLRDGYRFDPGLGWRRMADLSIPLAASPSPAPTFGAYELMLAGGDDGSRGNLPASPSDPGFNNAAFAYDTRKDSWRQAGTAPAPRVTVPVVRWNDRWVIPSGEQRPGIRSPEVWSLHASSE